MSTYRTSLLFYWKDFYDNTRAGRVNWLYNDSENLRRGERGGIVWCLTRTQNVSGVTLVARYSIESSAERSDAADPYAREYGMWRVKVDEQSAQFFDPSPSADADRVLRDLSFPLRAEHIGQSMQGRNSVRVLTLRDLQKLDALMPLMRLHPELSK